MADSESGASANVVLDSAEGIAKQVGSDGKHDVVISADDKAKQVGLEADKKVVSADGIANQVGSERKHADVGRTDRWKRVAKGRGHDIAQEA